LNAFNIIYELAERNLESEETPPTTQKQHQPVIILKYVSSKNLFWINKYSVELPNEVILSFKKIALSFSIILNSVLPTICTWYYCTTFTGIFLFESVKTSQN